MCSLISCERAILLTCTFCNFFDCVMIDSFVLIIITIIIIIIILIAIKKNSIFRFKKFYLSVNRFLKILNKVVTIILLLLLIIMIVITAIIIKINN